MASYREDILTNSFGLLIIFSWFAIFCFFRRYNQCITHKLNGEGCVELIRRLTEVMSIGLKEFSQKLSKKTDDFSMTNLNFP